MNAVGGGIANIQIRQHLDLRVDNPVPDGFEQLEPILDWIPESVRTIRVRDRMRLLHMLRCIRIESQGRAEGLLASATCMCPGGGTRHRMCLP